MAKEVTKKETKKTTSKKETVKEKPTKVKKDISEKIEDIKEDIEDKVEDFKDKIEDIGDKIEDKVDELEDKIEDKVDDVKDKIKEVKKQPKVKKVISFIKECKWIILIAIVFILIMPFVNNTKTDNDVYTKAESTLKDLKKMSNLQTIEYTYNAVATKYNEKDKKEIEYNVSYDGIVTAGIKFDDIEIKQDTKNKKIIIILPEIEIQDKIVDENSLDFIFTKAKYDTPNTLKEATSLCKKDLAKRVNDSDLIYKAAQENAVTTVKGFFEPWIKSVSDKYIVEVK